MPNDTTTLNGALSELGETLAANLTTKGVFANANDGLTTLANKILQISDSNILFEDNCDSTYKSEYYGAIIPVSSSTTTNNTTYDSTENAYLTNANGDWGCIPILALTGQENYKISAYLKPKSTSSHIYRCGFGFISANTTYPFYNIRIQGNGDLTFSKYQNGSETERQDTHNLNVTSWHKIEIIKQGDDYDFKWYDTDDTTVLVHYNATFFLPNVICGLYVVGGSNYGGYVKNIKVEALDDNATILFEDGGITSNKNNDFIYNANEGNYAITTNSTGTTFLYITTGQGEYIPNINISDYSDLEITWTFTYGTRYACQTTLLNSNKTSPNDTRWHNGGTSTPTTTWYTPSGTTTISHTLEAGDKMKLIKHNDVFSFYCNDELISSVMPSFTVAYIGFTSADNNRPFGYKDLIIKTKDKPFTVIYRPILDGTENITTIATYTPTISNNELVTGCGYLTNGWNNTIDWELTFDYYTTGDNNGYLVIPRGTNQRDYNGVQQWYCNQLNLYVNGTKPTGYITNATSCSQWIYVKVTKIGYVWTVYYDGVQKTTWNTEEYANIVDEWTEMCIGLDKNSSRNSAKIRNIMVKTFNNNSDSGSDCAQYQTEIANAIEYINGSGS